MAEKEYIERNAALHEAEKYGCNMGCVSGRHSGIADIIADNILKIPAADVAPVVHGRWEVYFICPWNGVIGSVRCSECGCVSTETGETGGNYCPRCGARMDGDKNDT